jgi:hypothetical protein
VKKSERYKENAFNMKRKDKRKGKEEEGEEGTDLN